MQATAVPNTQQQIWVSADMYLLSRRRGTEGTIGVSARSIHGTNRHHQQLRTTVGAIPAPPPWSIPCTATHGCTPPAHIERRDVTPPKNASRTRVQMRDSPTCRVSSASSTSAAAPGLAPPHVPVDVGEEGEAAPPVEERPHR